MNLDHEYAQLVGVHDGEDNNFSRAAPINRNVFHTLIGPSVNNCYRNLWKDEMNKEAQTRVDEFTKG